MSKVRLKANKMVIRWELRRPQWDF